MRKGQHKKNLTDGECNNLVPHLLTRASSGKLPKGVAEDIDKLFDCTPTTVRRIWRRASADLSGSKTICATVHQRKKGQSGRTPTYPSGFKPYRSREATASAPLLTYSTSPSQPS
ncbi:hypothetical protein DYB30_013319 [Aphanomyces astaci]|uniref:DUF7769 domain-containing protein n=1 Tax=Aphanomyces astaci TaxID=112090 RepID=A0A397DMJ3_APHAT|nr:hypothetical protein DYB36_013420 [Aphanomyces astaci]RHY67118.1 hypothetical protein DYB30_013319 [Aphanomyces astaci]RHY71037.1 hypothetical protein DYB38_014277 [Aphanomyces astaci]RHZ07391.1 hypothetical protein DYB31_008841 [Aphanomyces astaci]RHZ23461.1 hypothetical protein DYB26_009227 [Aphanomyces astaci]